MRRTTAVVDQSASITGGGAETNAPEKIVTTIDALIAATKDKSVGRIVVGGHLTGAPSLRLSPGQSLHGADEDARVTFARDADGVQLTSDNRIGNLRLDAAPARRAIFNDTTVTSLGRIELRYVTTTAACKFLRATRCAAGTSM